MVPTHHPLSKLSLLLLPLLLMPAAGLAATQEAPPQEAAPAPAQERLLDESKPPRERASRAERLGAEFGLGLLTGAAGGVAGSLLGGLVACRTSSFTACLVGSIGGLHLGFALAAPLGVWWAGSLTGADGNYGSALLGGLVGAVVGVLLYLPISYVALAAPLLGAVIGYGMSISPEPEAPAVALGSTRIVPLLSVSPQGSFVGLGGHF